MDETDIAQTPLELLIILAAAADEGIPLQTIAPKFSGRFNKGVDYAGDVSQFAREMEFDLAAIAHAVRQYGLPGNLKLSIHSGSDKFSVYPAIHSALKKCNAGVHLKTAGTTWLEEIIGLAEAGERGSRSPRRFTPRPIDTAKNCVTRTPQSLTSTRTSFPRRRKLGGGRPRSSLPHSGTTPVRILTTAAFASCSMSVSR
jgi:hypothetical protein